MITRISAAQNANGVQVKLVHSWKGVQRNYLIKGKRSRNLLAAYL